MSLFKATVETANFQSTNTLYANNLHVSFQRWRVIKAAMLSTALRRLVSFLRLNHGVAQSSTKSVISISPPSEVGQKRPQVPGAVSVEVGQLCPGTWLPWYLGTFQQRSDLFLAVSLFYLVRFDPESGQHVV